MKAKTGMGSMGSERAQGYAKRAVVVALIILTGATLGGCVGTVDSGYTSAYYVPNYAPYYADYGYGGLPYWGDGPYIGNTVVIAGRSHRGYYGRHHFAHDFGRRSGFSRAAHGGGRGGMHVNSGASRAGRGGGHR